MALIRRITATLRVDTYCAKCGWWYPSRHSH
ncbi:hypothetical protein SFUL_3701 [Streptomyces microflavus DSM 40593]|uniref:Uncharacterized protein n=1 Tax=Streptomyces microflavus DSM 40593 TaxID=1303692 RepID=N0CUR7_STRMI|nr:hypothetical protein SFUL_3701 [Streptomyces microflavus DSM 40593]